jgi:hypothetical protein
LGDQLARFAPLVKVPMLMFSFTACRDPGASHDAGAFTVFHTRTDVLLARLLPTVEANRWARLAAALAARAAAAASRLAVPPVYATSELAHSHCMRPMPLAAGGHMLALTGQQLLFTLQCACFEKLCKPLTKAIVEEATVLGIDDGGYCVVGEAAASYWTQRARGCNNEDTRGRTTVLDIAVALAEAVPRLARRCAAVLSASEAVVAAYLAHAAARIVPMPRSEADAPAAVTHHGHGAQPAPPAEPAPPEFVSVQADAASNVTSVGFKLEPIGRGIVCVGDRDKQPRSFAWPVVRIHVLTPPEAGAASAAAATTASADAKSQRVLAMFNSAEEAVACTRFCPGTHVINAQATHDDLLADAPAWALHRRQLLAQLVREEVISPRSLA